MIPPRSGSDIDGFVVGGLGVRPHHLAPASDGPIAGVVRLVEHLGNETLVTVETATDTVGTVSLDGKSDVAVSMAMNLQIERGEALVFNEQGLAL